MLKIEQDRIASHLDRIQEPCNRRRELSNGHAAVLAETFDLARDCHAAYVEANDATRRLFNQAFFTKTFIDEDDDTRERSGALRL